MCFLLLLFHYPEVRFDFDLRETYRERDFTRNVKFSSGALCIVSRTTSKYVQ